MKQISKLAVLLSLGALSSLSAFAAEKTPEQSYLENCRKDAGFPVPTVVVSPRVSQEAANQVVELEFVVESTGATSGFRVKSAQDILVADAVVDAVKQWRFSPAQRNGAPVATKVVLPVRIVDNGT